MEQGEIGLKGESKELGSEHYSEYYFEESRVNEDDETNDPSASKQKVIFQCHFGTVCSHRLEYTKPSDENKIYIGKLKLGAYSRWSSSLCQAEFGQNDHLKDTSHFTIFFGVTL